MNLRTENKNKKLLEEFNKHSDDLAGIIVKRKEILNEVSISPGQIWETVNGKRIIIISKNNTTTYYMIKSGKSAMKSEQKKSESFETDLFKYIGTAGDAFITGFLGHDGQITIPAKDKATRTKMVAEVNHDDLPF